MKSRREKHTRKDGKTFDIEMLPIPRRTGHAFDKSAYCVTFCIESEGKTHEHEVCVPYRQQKRLDLAVYPHEDQAAIQELDNILWDCWLPKIRRWLDSGDIPEQCEFEFSEEDCPS